MYPPCLSWPAQDQSNNAKANLYSTVLALIEMFEFGIMLSASYLYLCVTIGSRNDAPTARTLADIPLLQKPQRRINQLVRDYVEESLTSSKPLV